MESQSGSTLLRRVTGATHVVKCCEDDDDEYRSLCSTSLQKKPLLDIGVEPLHRKECLEHQMDDADVILTFYHPEGRILSTKQLECAKYGSVTGACGTSGTHPLHLFRLLNSPTQLTASAGTINNIDWQASVEDAVPRQGTSALYSSSNVISHVSNSRQIDTVDRRHESAVSIGGNPRVGRCRRFCACIKGCQPCNATQSCDASGLAARNQFSDSTTTSYGVQRDLLQVAPRVAKFFLPVLRADRSTHDTRSRCPKAHLSVAQTSEMPQFFERELLQSNLDEFIECTCLIVDDLWKTIDNNSDGTGKRGSQDRNLFEDRPSSACTISTILADFARFPGSVQRFQRPASYCLHNCHRNDEQEDNKRLDRIQKMAVDDPHSATSPALYRLASLIAGSRSVDSRCWSRADVMKSYLSDVNVDPKDIPQVKKPQGAQLQSCTSTCIQKIPVHNSSLNTGYPGCDGIDESLSWFLQCIAQNSWGQNQFTAAVAEMEYVLSTVSLSGELGAGRSQNPHEDITKLIEFIPSLVSDLRNTEVDLSQCIGITPMHKCNSEIKAGTENADVQQWFSPGEPSVIRFLLESQNPSTYWHSPSDTALKNSHTWPTQLAVEADVGAADTPSFESENERKIGGECRRSSKTSATTTEPAAPQAEARAVHNETAGCRCYHCLYWDLSSGIHPNPTTDVDRKMSQTIATYQNSMRCAVAVPHIALMGCFLLRRMSHYGSACVEYILQEPKKAMWRELADLALVFLDCGDELETFLHHLATRSLLDYCRSLRPILERILSVLLKPKRLRVVKCSSTARKNFLRRIDDLYAHPVVLHTQSAAATPSCDRTRIPESVNFGDGVIRCSFPLVAFPQPDTALSFVSRTLSSSRQFLVDPRLRECNSSSQQFNFRSILGVHAPKGKGIKRPRPRQAVDYERSTVPRCSSTGLPCAVSGRSAQ